jgi:hypothetical protein
MLQKNQEISDQLSQRRLMLANQVMFTLFLELWNDGKTDRAEVAMQSFSPKSREKTAAEFLIDDRPLSAKKVDFQDRISAESRAFWLFTLAEYFHKNNNIAMALETYTQCIEMNMNPSDSDEWFVNRAKERLKQLQKQE